MIRLLVALLLAIALAGPLAGCGKKGDLEQPKEEKTKYPRPYPQ